MKDIKYMNTLWHKIELEEKKSKAKSKQLKTYLIIISLVGILSLSLSLIFDAISITIYPICTLLMVGGLYVEHCLMRVKEDTWH